MRKYLDFVLVVSIFGIVVVGALAASGRIDSAFGSLARASRLWLRGLTNRRAFVLLRPGACCHK
jgi:hypothetical protein